MSNYSTHVLTMLLCHEKGRIGVLEKTDERRENGK